MLLRVRLLVDVLLRRFHEQGVGGRQVGRPAWKQWSHDDAIAATARSRTRRDGPDAVRNALKITKQTPPDLV